MYWLRRTFGGCVIYTSLLGKYMILKNEKSFFSLHQKGTLHGLGWRWMEMVVAWVEICHELFRAHYGQSALLMGKGGINKEY